MFEFARRLLRDFTFLLKIQKLIVATICLHELSKYSEYSIPRWLWVIYCIDSFTYSIIYFVIAMAHVFEKPRITPEFTYFSLGVIFNLIGGIAGVHRERNRTSLDIETHRSEMKIGLLLIANFIVLFFETAHMAYTEFLKIRQASATGATNVHARAPE